VDAVLSSDFFVESCEFFSLEGNDGSKRFLAMTACKSNDQIVVIFTIPTSASNVYITVTDGDRKLIRQVLATIEDFERDGTVRLGGVMLLDDPGLRSHDIVGVIFLPVNTSNILDYLPDKIVVEGVEHRFLLVVFLRSDEHEIWRKYGHDSLMDFFKQNGKDLVLFRPDTLI